MNKISTIYLKELSNINEIFKANSKLPLFLKKVILFIKKIFCIVTVNEEKIYILPYQEVESVFKIKMFFIRKILVKLNSQIILSNYLDNLEGFKNIINNLDIELIEGKRLSEYLIVEIIEYICKMQSYEMTKQEITVMIEKQTVDKMKLILDIAKRVKRLQIVTTKMEQFKKLENQLWNEFGIACQITNNKRKSLSKAKIIVNLDNSQERLKQFIINTNAIIIDIAKQNPIHSKAFNGIYIYDYTITTNNVDIMNNNFDIKKIYEKRTIGANYENVRKLIKEDQIRIINLIGKNGIIPKSDYVRTCKN